MGKIAIITLNGYFNYGNRLQNFALQEVLKSMKFEVETIVYINNSQKPRKPFIKRIINILKKGPIKIIYIVCHRFIDKVNHNPNRYIHRTRCFKVFTLENIKETDYTISDKKLPDNLSGKYDYFVVGSDQVWNPSYNEGSSFFFLSFAEKHKRIAYAPSFGVSEIKPEFIEKYKEWLTGMHRISVREEDGAKIIKDLTGRDAPVLVDPTMLLTREKWLTIAKEARNKPKKNYLLTFFLGGQPNQYRKQIKNCIRDNNLDVINLGDYYEKNTYMSGPGEFIDYINSCSLVFTDSFHGTVFAILFEKPFIVFKRPGSMNMYSRINTLLDKFELNSRKIENISSKENILNMDFSSIPTILEVERKKAMDYLKEVLNVEDV